MATTDFGALTTEELKVWSMDLWKVARKKSFWEQFTGTDENAPLQRITEFKKDMKGAKAVITLVPDVQGRGVIGDEQLTGNEAAMSAYDFVFEVDQQRQGVKSKGRMTEQKSVVDFRKTARNSLGYWLADMRDTLITLKLSGYDFNIKLDSSANTPGGAHDTLANLAFAGAVAPTSKRKLALRLNGSTKEIVVGSEADVADAELRTFTYADIVNLKAMARERGIKPVRDAGGNEMFHLIMAPTAFAKLKLDSDFISNVRHAGVRGDTNSLFRGTTNSVMVDGVMIHDSFYIVTTRGVSAPNKFGATGGAEGQRALFLGAQAGGVADIGDMGWHESDVNDYGNQPGIAISKIWGIGKTQFKGSWDDHANLQDFGIITVDSAL